MPVSVCASVAYRTDMFDEKVHRLPLVKIPGAIESPLFLSPLRGSTIVALLSPGSLWLTRGYCLSRLRRLLRC